MQCFDQCCEAALGSGAVGRHACIVFEIGELVGEVGCQTAGLAEAASGETEPNHRVAYAPIPVVVDGEATEQRLAALEELLQGVHEKALTETPRAREKVVGAFRDQLLDVRGLVDVVAVLFAQLAKGLDASWQFASAHCCT